MSPRQMMMHELTTFMVLVQGLYERISTWKRKNVLPESTSSYTLDLLEVPGFEMSELPFLTSIRKF